jgi:hypothetical protein
MSDPNRNHYFISLPVSDPSLIKTLTSKELISLGLGLGLPILFALKLLKTDQLWRHSLLWVVLVAVWIAICGHNVFHSIISALRIRKYASAVDSDAVELGRKLYKAEREARGIEKTFRKDKYFINFDFSLIEIEDLPFSDEVEEEEPEYVPQEIESDETSNQDINDENS